MTVQFIDNYAEEFGIPQPAAPRCRDDTAPIYLTASTTAREIHETYVMGTFFELGKDKAAKGEGWAPPFISCVQDTVGL